MKKLIAVILSILMIGVLLIGCTTDGTDVSTPSDDSDNADTTPVESTPTETTPPPAVSDYDGDFAPPTDSATDVADGEYINVADVDAKYRSKLGSLVYIDAKAPQMEIGGITHPESNGGEYYRLDVTQKSSYSQQNSSLANHTSGVTIRFRTNASQIQIKATLRNSSTSYEHFADRGAFGWDVYTGTGTNRVYCGAESQLITDPNSIKEIVMLPGGYQEVTINLPLYAGISSLQIGFPADAQIAPPTERSYGTVCFYGSSITQGGCVSRPGLSYSNIICRMLNADNMNLGFSGSAKGEQSIAQYIAKQDIAAFVMDYDYNNTVLGLRDTHYAFYQTVRAAHPDIPIIMVSRPVYLSECTAEQLERQVIIKQSYDRAVESGDKNVYYVCGNDFFSKEMPDLYSVDMVHPNDLGHYNMAKAIFAVLKPALDKAQ